MTEQKLVSFTENLMIYITGEIEGQKKLTLTAKVHLIDSIREALREVKRMPDKG